MATLKKRKLYTTTVQDVILESFYTHENNYLNTHETTFNMQQTNGHPNTQLINIKGVVSQHLPGQ